MLKREAPQSIAEYSDALRRRLAGVLPPEKIDEVVAETEAHLSDAADALREEADVFEQVAVRRFVSAKALARGVSRAWAPTYLRHSGTATLQTIGLTVAVLGLVAVAALFAGEPWMQIIPLMVAVFASVLLCFVLALAACRAQLSRYIWLLFAALTLGSLYGGNRFGQIAAPFYFVSRYAAPATLARHNRQYALRSEEIAVLEMGRRFVDQEPQLTRHEATWPLALRNAEGILLPRGYDTAPSAFHCTTLGAPNPVLWRTHDPEQATRVWRANADLWADGLRSRQLSEAQPVRNKLIALIAAPRWRFETDAARWMGRNLGITAGLLLLADLAGGTLGGALLRARRRRYPSPPRRSWG